MADDGWSRALMAASGVPVASDARDDGLRAIVMEARADGLSRERVIALAQHREPAVREAVAARPDCPLGMQATLAHDRRTSVRVALASGPGLAGSIASVLAQDRELSVLKALARNAATPRAVLGRLAEHRREDVARLARRSLDGVVLGAHPARVEEIEERPRATAPPTAGTPSPVGERAAGVLAPRPSVPPRGGARPAH
ncbi:hypothetical protein QQX09_04190 [Demequina sp. SYSU T00192]|uniref:Leucine rich repeat variant n=1 Tax=Demequina litoralis TaxID=3051660 RepID=A0ABT8G7F0_9MICO|nr:hypothetical protein [Demequina sp. SYSU T00192]MDN4475056.1 hypothetical protein [Demequina sp. SYSU T00192]